MIRNFLTTESETHTNSHGGSGEITIQKVFRRADFSGAWDFALRVVLSPGASMGLHRHGNDEEMYILLKGQGVMTLDGVNSRVGVGDMILNKPGGEHGFLNDTEEEVEMLIIQASNKS